MKINNKTPMIALHKLNAVYLNSTLSSTTCAVHNRIQSTTSQQVFQGKGPSMREQERIMTNAAFLLDDACENNAAADLTVETSQNTSIFLDSFRHTTEKKHPLGKQSHSTFSSSFVSHPENAKGTETTTILDCNKKILDNPLLKVKSPKVRQIALCKKNFQQV